MCLVIVDLALCDSTCPYAAADLPSGCLKIYPYTYSEFICGAAEGVLGCCGCVDMQKREYDVDTKIEKRVCESCVAWSALMRERDGRRARRSFRSAESLQSDSDTESQEAVLMTPPESAGSSDDETAEAEGNDELEET